MKARSVSDGQRPNIIMRTSNNPNQLPHFADVLLDPWFKRTFKEYGNAKRLMQLFLEALLPERQIESLEYTSEESTNQNPDSKGVRVDVECVDKNGDRFVVEVQRAKQADFYDRAVYNSTFSVQRQLVPNSGRYRFRPVYFIGIMRFTLNPDSEKFLYKYSLREDETGKLMTDDLHYTFLEVTKCHDSPEASFVEKIGYALNNMESFERRPDSLAGEFFDLLFNSADISKFANEDKIKYLNDMTTERDIQNQIEYSNEEGYRKGKAEGRVEGRAEGIELVAANLKAEGLPLNVIAKATGLTEEQIKAL